MSVATAGIVAGAIVVATAVVRGGVVARARRMTRALTPPRLGADGIVVGAEPMMLRGAGDRGILLLHGFNDTPQSVAHLAYALHAAGWTVSVPLLAHHGRGERALATQGTARAWTNEARAAWRALREVAPRAVLGGQSMGGALAVTLAAEFPPTALVLLAPYLRMGRLPRALSSVWPLWQLVVPVLVSRPGESLRDPDARARSLGTGRFTPRLTRELKRVIDAAWPLLREVTAPTLVIHARTDYRIPRASATRAFASLASGDKTLDWLPDSGHIVAADLRREDVATRVTAWLESRIPA